MKKMYIAGCGGMLGEAFYKHFSKKYEVFAADVDINEEWLHKIDFRNFSEYKLDVKNFETDILVHLGAHTDLEYCENNSDDAYLTNTLSVSYARMIANEFKIPLVYISTAGVFDGSKKVFDDWDKPNPLGVYARSKYMGEIEAAKAAHGSYIMRAGWMMGGGRAKDKKFIGKIIKQLDAGCKELYIVDDKFGTPTYTWSFARNADIIIESKLDGLYNLVCRGETSRLEVANELLKLLNLQNNVQINEVDSNHFSREYFAPRPYSEILVNKKLDILGLNIMPDWKLGLSEYLENF